MSYSYIDCGGLESRITISSQSKLFDNIVLREWLFLPLFYKNCGKQICNLISLSCLIFLHTLNHSAIAFHTKSDWPRLTGTAALTSILKYYRLIFLFSFKCILNILHFLLIIYQLFLKTNIPFDVADLTPEKAVVSLILPYDIFNHNVFPYLL